MLTNQGDERRIKSSPTRFAAGIAPDYTDKGTLIFPAKARLLQQRGCVTVPARIHRRRAVYSFSVSINLAPGHAAMKFSLPTSLFALVCAVSFSFASGLIQPPRVAAQSVVLAEVYGRGVHAYHAGRIIQSYDLLSMAIDSGLEDPRAYYYRGLAAYASGRPEEAKDDWKAGAAVEAQGDFGGSIGRSLSRVQGTIRMELEMIREQARLAALTEQMKRSKIRYGEMGSQPAPARPAAAAPPAVNRRAASPPPPPADNPPADNPFADDEDAEPIVESKDALEEASKNVAAAKASAAQPAKPAPSNDPFASEPSAQNDPFSSPAGDDPFAAPADDPFGTPAPQNNNSAPSQNDDPFGGDPFGADPFGADPFGN